MPGEVTFLPLTRLQQPHVKYPNTRVRYTCTCTRVCTDVQTLIWVWLQSLECILNKQRFSIFVPVLVHVVHVHVYTFIHVHV